MKEITSHKFIMLLVVLAIGTSCASTTALVSSRPEGAQVFFADESGELTLLGQTPLNINPNQFRDSGSQPHRLVINKDGYRRESIIMPPAKLPENWRISVTLESTEEFIKAELRRLGMEPGENQTAALECPKLNEFSYAEIAQGVAETLTLIGQREFVRAKQVIGVMLVRYPFISVLHDLLGNAQYLQGDFNEALASYERSLKLNPENHQTRSIALQLRRQVRGNQDIGGGE